MQTVTSPIDEPLGKFIVVGYDGDNPSYPIIGAFFDPRATDYTCPNIFDAHPDSTTYPDHIFIKAVKINDKRVQHVYQILPGNILSDNVFDQRFGIMFNVASRLVRTPTSGSIEQVDGAVIVTENKSEDAATSLQTVTTLPALPSNQVIPGLRREQFPPVLIGVSIVGTETLDAVPTYVFAPDSPLRSRTTRIFSYGPPDPSLIPDPPVFWAVPFHETIDYLLTSHTTTGTSGSRSESETSSNNSSRTESGTSSSTNSGTHSGTESSTMSSTESGTHSGTNSSTSSSSSSGTESATHSGTESGTVSHTDSSTRSSTESGTHSVYNSTVHSLTESVVHSSSSSSSGVGNDTITTSNTGAPLTTDPHNYRTIVSSEDRTVNATNNSSANTTGNTVSNSTSNGTNNATHNITSNSTTNSTHNNTGNSTVNGTRNITENSTTNGTNNGTSNRTSNVSSNASGNSTNNGSSNSSSNSTINNSSNISANTVSSSSSVTTGRALLRVDFPPCLHDEITV